MGLEKSAGKPLKKATKVLSQAIGLEMVPCGGGMFSTMESHQLRYLPVYLQASAGGPPKL